MRTRAFLKVERALGVSIATALSAAAATSCSSQPVVCGGCNCGDASTQNFDVAFATCADASAFGDASAFDASTDDASAFDASTDAAGDGSVACFATCDDACTASHPNAICTGTDDAGLVAHCQVSFACIGRRLEGLVEPHGVATHALGAWFARAAWLEGASVHAFRRLARELRAYGAPVRLIREANASARDEARHARIMARFAKKHGARVPRVQIERATPRDLETIARENAIEGCVGETFGAALGAWTSSRASVHADVATAMGAVAPDELRHAVLGWEIATWADQRLSRAARARVREARLEAAHDLVQNTPNAEERALAHALMTELWAA